MRAFARLDGLLIGLSWTASFACYVIGLSTPGLGLLALGLALFTPFFAALRLRRFRDQVLGGAIGFGRAWGYTLLEFFYACIIFAIAQFVYFQWMDHGHFVQALSQMLTIPESAAMLRQSGMMQMVDESLRMLAQMRPIDLVLNIMSSNMMICFVVSLPIAAIMKRNRLQKV
ncbi:MAG: DUF4199 domain-containing protein [Prevotella sp.]|nr:DUF4199 domain-containing protein [Prevotella sp.]